MHITSMRWAPLLSPQSKRPPDTLCPLFCVSRWELTVKLLYVRHEPPQRQPLNVERCVCGQIPAGISPAASFHGQITGLSCELSLLNLDSYVPSLPLFNAFLRQLQSLCLDSKNIHFWWTSVNILLLLNSIRDECMSVIRNSWRRQMEPQTQ